MNIYIYTYIYMYTHIQVEIWIGTHAVNSQKLECAMCNDSRFSKVSSRVIAHSKFKSEPIFETCADV